MSVSVAQQKMFVDGAFVDALSGETMEVLNPATGEVIAEVPRAGEEDVDRAVAAAERAWETWREKTPKDRMQLLLALAEVIDDNAEELARLESRNVGKPWWVAVDEPGVMSDNLRFFAGAARNLEGKAAAEYVEGYTSMIRREPLGIVAGIAPWNYPLFMVIWKMAPALAAGNVQIVKPAEQTPLTTLRFVELAQDILPNGVLQVVTGDGVPAGDRLVRHPSIRLVSLTGDTATGKLIAKKAADLDRLGDGRWVGVVEHDHRRLATELEVHALDGVGRVLRDQLPGRRVARERDEAHRRMPYQAIAGRNAVPGHDLEDALREDLLRQLDEAQHRQRRLLGRLDDLDVAGGERRAHLPDDHEERVVPRRDPGDDAERLAADHRGVALDVLGGGLALEVSCRAGEEAKVVGHQARLVDGDPPGLADVP